MQPLQFTPFGLGASYPVWGTAKQNSPATPPTKYVMHVSTTHLCNSMPHLCSLLKAFWELESLGIKQEEPYLFKNGCYEVNLVGMQ